MFRVTISCGPQTVIGTQAVGEMCDNFGEVGFRGSKKCDRGHIGYDAACGFLGGY
jgi:predicted RNA-binding Zn-ribbon protein involved in translation (DUF1610 family)